MTLIRRFSPNSLPHAKTLIPRDQLAGTPQQRPLAGGPFRRARVCASRHMASAGAILSAGDIQGQLKKRRAAQIEKLEGAHADNFLRFLLELRRLAGARAVRPRTS